MPRKIRDDGPGAEGPAATLAARLRAARARLGLTVRQMGELTGVPWTSLAALEQGREPRWSTLMRYLETVPGLRAGELLPAAHPVPPAASRSVHQFVLDGYGCSARRVSLHVKSAPGERSAIETRIEGMRWTGRPGPRAIILPRLLQACGVSSRSVLNQITHPPLHRKLLAFEDGPTRWSYQIGGDEDHPEVACRIVTSTESPATLARMDLAIPTEELELVVSLPPSASVAEGRVIVFPTARGAEGEAANIVQCLYPAGLPVAVTGREMRATIPIPMPDLTYVLRAASAADAPLHGASEPSTLAGITRRLRERSGWSTREIARRMDVSHATVLAAERGRDASAGTLRAFLTAVPDTPPQALLPASSPRASASLVEAWEWYREAHLLEAESLEDSRVVLPDGTRETQVRLVGLRSLDPAERAVKILLSADTGILSRGNPQVLSIVTEAEEDEDDVRVRTYERMAQGVRHAVTIPGRRSRRGLTLSETRRNAGTFALSLAEAQARAGTSDPDFVVGGSSHVRLPTRRLVHEFRFPPNARLRDHYIACRPVTLVPVQLDTSWIERLHPGGYRAEFDLRNGRFRLEVEHPLCGFSYGFGAYLA